MRTQLPIIYPDNYPLHQPPFEIFNGEQTPHNEVSARVERILSALRANGFAPQPSKQAVDLALVKQVHAPAYVDYLQRSCAQIADGESRYPSVFRYRTGRSTQQPLGEFGNYSFDLYTPLQRSTYDVAASSAAAATEVSQLVLSGQTRVGYALCRPPGHHAEFDQMGGYCYLNNCAIAAQLLTQGGKVATLDVDFHHGNGTQHIFYRRDDVFTASIHAHPDWKFPYFSGYEDERGAGRGQGSNLNRTAGAGTTDAQYQQMLESVLDAITAFHPSYLVISLGLDTHADDPIGGFALTTAYFTTMARTIAQLNLPTVIVQEGGYNTQVLGTNVVAFLQGF